MAAPAVTRSTGVEQRCRSARTSVSIITVSPRRPKCITSGRGFQSCEGGTSGRADARPERRLMRKPR